MKQTRPTAATVERACGSNKLAIRGEAPGWVTPESLIRRLDGRKASTHLVRVAIGRRGGGNMGVPNRMRQDLWSSALAQRPAREIFAPPVLPKCVGGEA